MCLPLNIIVVWLHLDAQNLVQQCMYFFICSFASFFVLLYIQWNKKMMFKPLNVLSLIRLSQLNRINSYHPTLIFQFKCWRSQWLCLFGSTYAARATWRKRESGNRKEESIHFCYSRSVLYYFWNLVVWHKITKYKK